MQRKNSTKTQLSQELIQLKLSLLERDNHIQQLESENRAIFAAACALLLRLTRVAPDDDQAISLLVTRNNDAG